MTRRRLLLFIAFLVGSLALGEGVWLLWPRTAINRGTFEEIRVGMTLKETEELIGLPPGQYGNMWRRVEVSSDEAENEFWRYWRSDGTKNRFVFWSSNDGEIIVSVSADEKVTGKWFYYLVDRRPGPLFEKVFELLGL